MTPNARAGTLGGRSDLLLEVFNKPCSSNYRRSRFLGGAPVALQNTHELGAFVNIKERLDFSCAVFDETGALVGQMRRTCRCIWAPGTASVETVIRLNAATSAPATVFALGTRPTTVASITGRTITVVSPVSTMAARKVLFWVASRGHACRCGWHEPSSMTTLAKTVDEERWCCSTISFLKWNKAASARRALRRPCSQIMPWPASNPDQNIADLIAQIAANRTRAARVEAHGGPSSASTRPCLHGPCGRNNADERGAASAWSCWKIAATSMPTTTGAVIR